MGKSNWGRDRFKRRRDIRRGLIGNVVLVWRAGARKRLGMTGTHTAHSAAAVTKEGHVSRTGVRGDAKKDGDGGRGTWGNAMQQDGPAAIDQNDPNYVDPEDSQTAAAAVEKSANGEAAAAAK
ncbi:hypothetical protein FVE85_1069 [Porphyridium purpureum]|uniref:Hyaluronan/mRNA-binding protein domain-containing protein n=1 Tax=Porphyridium purpureum TaxID=35688 RepID=A0A5J4Z240_PORPP|nr:hypothetical protein FVE85_1069 [Porphyridium purpureum]|eukprot:POR8163..scf208_2